MCALQPYWLRNLDGAPLIGDWAVNAGKVHRIITKPCEIEPEILVTAFFHELPYLLWGVLKPDPVDLRARNIGGGELPQLHSRRRRRGKRRMFRWRVDDYLAAYFVRKDPIPTAFFNLGQFAQRVGWWFMVADLTSEFLVRWTSTTYEWQGCLPIAGWANGEVDAVWSPAGGSGTFSAPFLFETAASSPATFQGVKIDQPANSEMILTAQLQLGRAQFQSGSWPTSAWLQEMVSGARYYLFENQTVGPSLFPDGEVEHESPRIAEDREWRVMVQSDGGSVIANPTGYFTGYPPTDSLLGADPP